MSLFPFLTGPGESAPPALDSLDDTLYKLFILELQDQDPYDPDPGHKVYLPAVPDSIHDQKYDHVVQQPYRYCRISIIQPKKSWVRTTWQRTERTTLSEK